MKGAGGGGGGEGGQDQAYYQLLIYVYWTQTYIVYQFQGKYDLYNIRFDSRRSNRSGRFLLPRTNTNRYKASAQTT